MRQGVDPAVDRYRLGHENISEEDLTVVGDGFIRIREADLACSDGVRSDCELEALCEAGSWW